MARTVNNAVDRRPQLVPLAAVQAVGLLCGVIGVRWTSAAIPPELLGLYGLLLSAVQAALAVTHQGFVKHVQQHWTDREPASPYLRRLLGASGAPTLWLAAGLAVVLAVLHLTGGVPASAGVYAWLLAANLGVALAGLLQTALQAEERYWDNFAVSALSSATRSFGPPLLVMLMGASLAVVTGAFLLHATVTVLAALWLLRGAWRRPGPPTPGNADELRRAVSVFAAAGACVWVGLAATRWLAALVLDARQIGFFVLAGNLTLIVPASVGAIMLNYSFPPLFARARAGASEAELWRATYRTLALVMVGSQAGLIALDWLAPCLIGPVIDARYAAATDWLLATGGATLAATTAQFFQNLLLARRCERACLHLNLASTAFRLAVMGAAVFAGVRAFGLALIALPWATVTIEWACTRRLLRGAGAPPTASSAP